MHTGAESKRSSTTVNLPSGPTLLSYVQTPEWVHNVRNVARNVATRAYTPTKREREKEKERETSGEREREGAYTRESKRQRERERETERESAKVNTWDW